MSSLETNFNFPPFYDDFSEQKNFHRVLFRPSVAVQARELTQLQTILQNQIERFGNHIFKDGTIITGCNFSFDAQYHYIKLSDLLVNGQPTNIGQYNNNFLVASSNLTAVVIDVADGFESQDPDMKTLYVKYINTGESNQKTFANSDVLNVYGRYANGEINNTNTIAQIIVANNTFSAPVGVGYGFTVADGIIFQKGHFVRVDRQSIVVEKYSTLPSDKKLGFVVEETIVNENIDTSLLSPATGFTNENAPGAHRLKLTPKLAVYTANSTPNSFFSLVEFQNGRPTKQRENTEYNNLGREFSKRTYEESGNYVINPFSLSSSAGNTTHLNLEVGSGLAYIDGYRVQQHDISAIPVKKGTTVKERQNQILSTNYGNYILVNEVIGNFRFNTGDTIGLFDAAGTKLTLENYTPAATGTQIGSAKIRSLTLNSGIPGTPNARYRLYVFDVTMNAGKNFGSVKSVYFSGTNSGCADVILENGIAYQYETNFNSLIFPFGQTALKTLRDLSANNDTTFTYRTAKTDGAFNTSGVITIPLPSGFVHPYTAGSTLNDTQEKDVVIIPQANAVTANLTGTVTYSNGTLGLVGTGTSFLSNFQPGQYIRVNGGPANKRITSVVNNTYLTVSSVWSGAASGSTYARYYPQWVPIQTSGLSGATMAVDGTGQTLTITLANGLGASTNAIVYYNATKQTAVQLNKTFNKNYYVKIDLSTHSANVVGPYSLGIPDVQAITAVYKHTSFTGIEANTYALPLTSFKLNNGQTDNKYGLATISPNGVALANTDKLLVVVSAFREDASAGGRGFYSVDSYPVDDATIPTPNTNIRTEQIPVYKSPTGKRYDLRNSIDFRPVVANTGVYSTNATSATTNPSLTEVFSGSERHFPTPNYNFSADCQYYLGRIDRIVMDSYGQVSVVEGIPSETPRAPDTLSATLALATATIPAYPSLSIQESVLAGRDEYAVKFEYSQNRRYTMKDIGQIDRRLSQIEYYTALSLLEKKSSDLVIPSSVDGSLNRFKNGIMVDPFNDFIVANVSDAEFKAAIDPMAGELIPSFEQDKIALMPASYSSTIKKGNIALLNYTHVEYMTQPYATRFRNLTEQYYSFKGTLWLNESVDNNFSTRTSPRVVTIDNASGVADLTNNLNRLNNLFPLVQTTESELVNQFMHGRRDLVSQFDLTTTTSQSALRTNINTSTVPVGDYVTDVSFSPVIRAQPIYLLAKGLRPNVQLTVFFDKVNVSAYTRKCNLISAGAEFVDGLVNRANYSQQWPGTTLTTNADGSFHGILYLPENDTIKFYTGERQVLLADVDQYDSLSSATTTATATFRAFNASVSKESLSISTRTADVELVTNTTSSTQRVQTVTRVDPLAQTFVVENPTSAEVEGVFITKIDLYFKKKSSSLGVTVDIRTTDNGYPASTVLPFSRRHLNSSEVSVSDTGTAMTTFEFSSPVFLKSGFEYCFVVTPDGNNPDYLLYCAEIGGRDLAQPNLVVSQDWGNGVMFMSHNNSAWTALQNEDIKFRMHRAQFAAQTGAVTLVNRDYEFLKVANTVGTFIEGERVSKVSANATGTVTLTVGSTTMTGSGTSFLSAISSGQYITIVANSTNYEVHRVQSIANNTSLVLADQSKVSVSNAAWYKSPVGIVSSQDLSFGKLVLDNSTAANSSFKFAAGDTIVGDQSSASCVVTVVEDKIVSYFQPMVNRVAVQGCSLGLTGATTSNTYTQTTGQNFLFNSTNYLDKNEAIIMSKSNEVVSLSGNKSFKFDIGFVSAGNVLSPVVDLDTASVLYYKNVINNNANNEHTLDGSAIAKYVSKTVNLADGLESEDLKVLVTAYRPSGTEVRVYAKFSNDNDNESFATKLWTQLELKDSTISSSSDRNNYVELEYNMPGRPVSTAIAGVVATTNASANIVGSGTTFQTNISAGDVVLIENGSVTNFFVSSVASVTDNTNIVLAGTVPFSSPATNIFKLDRPREAYKNPQNDGILSYINGAGAQFNTYKSFAIKIVLLAESTHQVPRLGDVSAIALTV